MASSLPARQVTVYKIIFCKKKKKRKKVMLKKVKKAKQKNRIFYYRKVFFFSTRLKWKRGRINYLHQNVLFCDIGKEPSTMLYSILFIDFFFLSVPSAVFILQSHVHLDVGKGRGGVNLVERHIGACVFASSLSMKIFYDIKENLLK